MWTCSSTKNVELSYFLHLCQVYIDIITRVVGVPLLLVLLYLLFQESHDLLVVGVESLVRSWQVLQQAREGIVQLLVGQTLSSWTNRTVYFMITTWWLRQIRNYLSLRRAGEQNGLIVQLQKLAKALIAVFKAMSEEHRGDDVTHAGRYGVVGVEWSSWEYVEFNLSGYISH